MTDFCLKPKSPRDLLLYEASKLREKAMASRSDAADLKDQAKTQMAVAADQDLRAAEYEAAARALEGVDAQLAGA